MESLIFLSATNIDRTISVINGTEGCAISRLGEFANSSKTLGPYNFFLDNVTGDMYTYQSEKGEWISRKNAGLHNRRW